MTSPRPRIEPTLLRVLHSRDGLPFTHKELVHAYRALEEEHGRSARASLQFINRNLARLTKAGWLEVIKATAKQPELYRWEPAEQVESPPAAVEALTVLRQKLQHHRVELLSTLGETEAYDEICADLPQLQPSVQRQYDAARDRSLKLLGRIRALETLIATQSSSAA